MFWLEDKELAIQLKTTEMIDFTKIVWNMSK
jgi:hypothetical protein